jgi:AcrR family transcriptional regulator
MESQSALAAQPPTGPRPGSRPAGSPSRRGRPPSVGRDEIIEAALAVLRERGVSRLTTREIAEHAGVSEGSIFYHFKDRAGLLIAVFMAGMEPLTELPTIASEASSVREALTRLATTVEAFLDSGVDILTAAQSDAGLREAFGTYMRDNDLGPHRGVRVIGGYLREQQAGGAVRNDIDPDVVAYEIMSSCFMRASQERLVGHARGVPTVEESIDMYVELLTPSSAIAGQWS